MNEPKTSGLAIASLVLGIVSIVLLCVGPLFAIPAIICGHIAYSRIKRSPGLLSGGGLALGGFITGYVSLGLCLLLLPIAIPNFVKARDAAQRNACVMQLKLIETAKESFAQEQRKPEGAPVTAADLSKYGVAPNTLKCPKGGVYRINPVGQKPTCSIPGHELSD
jgi:competence protein ComGC